MTRFVIGFVVAFSALGAWLYWRQGGRAKSLYDEAYARHRAETGPEIRSTNVRGDVAPIIRETESAPVGETAPVPVIEAPAPTSKLAPTTSLAGVSPTVGGVTSLATPTILRRVLS